MYSVFVYILISIIASIHLRCLSLSYLLRASLATFALCSSSTYQSFCCWLALLPQINYLTYCCQLVRIFDKQLASTCGLDISSWGEVGYFRHPKHFATLNHFVSWKYISIVDSLNLYYICATNAVKKAINFTTIHLQMRVKASRWRGENTLPGGYFRHILTEIPYQHLLRGNSLCLYIV